MGTPTTTAPNSAAPVPPLDDELEGLLEDTSGIHFAIDVIRSGFRILNTVPLSRDDTQTILSALLDSGSGTDLIALVGATVARLSDADANPCLRELPADTIADLRRIGGAIAVDLQTSAPRDLAGELPIRIDPFAEHRAGGDR